MNTRTTRSVIEDRGVASVIGWRPSFQQIVFMGKIEACPVSGLDIPVDNRITRRYAEAMTSITSEFG
jgi:hypothetical protein